MKKLICILLLVVTLVFLKKYLILNEYTKQIYINDKIKEEQGELLKMLEVTHTIFDRNNVWYIIYYGTLLGAVRHWGFIPWDNDIDLIVSVNQKDHILSLTNEFRKAGYEIYSTWSILRIRPLGRKSPNIDIFLFDDIDDKPMRCAVNASKKEEKIIDKWKKKGQCEYLENRWWSKPSFINSGWANNSFGGNKLGDVRRVLYNFENISVYGPDNPQEVIQKLYGKKALTVCKISHNHEINAEGEIKINYSKDSNTQYDCSKLPLQIP